MSVSERLLSPYHDGTSAVHRSDAAIKLALTLAYVLAVNATPVRAWPIHLGYAVLGTAVIALARLPLERVLRRALLAAPFVLMAVLGAPFVREGRPILTLPLLDGRLVLTDVGLSRLANVAVKSWLSLCAVVTLTLTTPFLEIVRASQRLGLPTVLSATILLMYRYLFVLADEAQRLMRARDARTGEAPAGSRGASLFWRATITGRLIGTLFLRTVERGERIYQAMLARGYDGAIRSLTAEPVGWRAISGSIALALLLVVLTLFANLHW